MIARDALNAAAVALIAASYPTAIVVNLDNYVGQTRTGGSPTPTAGNLWDINSNYAAIVSGSPDGHHFNDAGYSQIALANNDALAAAGLIGTLAKQNAIQSSIAALNNPTTAQIASAIWQDATPGDFTTPGSIGLSLFTGVAPGAPHGLSTVLVASANISSSELSTGLDLNI
jgi:hypothetical protein